MNNDDVTAEKKLYKSRIIRKERRKKSKDTQHKGEQNDYG
jgi:hypothetical protein